MIPAVDYFKLILNYTESHSSLGECLREQKNA